VPSTNVIIIIHLILFTLHNTKNIAYLITETLIFYAYKLMVMGNSKNWRVFNFTISLKSRKWQKFDAREIYMFYSILPLWPIYTYQYLYHIHCFRNLKYLW